MYLIECHAEFPLGVDKICRCFNSENCMEKIKQALERARDLRSTKVNAVNHENKVKKNTDSTFISKITYTKTKSIDTSNSAIDSSGV